MTPKLLTWAAKYLAFMSFMLTMVILSVPHFFNFHFVNNVKHIADVIAGVWVYKSV